LIFPITSTRIVTIDTTSQTVGTLNLGDDDDSNSYNLAASGGASLIFDNNGPNAVINQLANSNGDTISAPVVLNASLTINNASANALVFSGGTSAGTAGLKTITNASAGSGAVTYQTLAIADGAGIVAFEQNSPTSQLNFNVASTHTGGVTVNAGIVWARNAAGLGTGTLTLGDTSGSADAALLVSTGSNSSINVTNPINVRAGTTGSLTIFNNNASSNSQATASGAITLNNNLTIRSAATGTAGSMTVSGPMSGTQPVTITTLPGTAPVTLSSAVSANVTSIIQDSAGSATISGQNSAFVGTVQVKQGTLTTGSQTATSVNNVVYVSVGATFSRGSTNTSASQARVDIAGINDGVGAGIVTRGTGGGARPLNIGGNDAYSFSGAIQDNGSSTNPLAIIKTGTGTQTLSGPSTYSGGTTILSGVIKLDGNTGSLLATGNLSMQGGTFLYDNTASTGDKTQNLGTLTFSAGGSTLQTVQGGASSSTLTFAALAARGAGGTGNFLVSGGTNTVVLTGPVLGFVNQGLFINGADYVYMNSDSGFIRAATYDTDPGFVNAGAALASASHNRVTTSIAAQPTDLVNTIKFDGATAVDLDLALDATLTLTNGGLLRAGGGSTTISGSGTANLSIAPDGEYVFRTDSASDSLTINVPLAANVSGTPVPNRIVKDGAGTLTLGAANLNTGQTYVNGGILSISSNANLGAQDPGAAVNLNNGTLQATATFGLFNGVAGTNNRGIVIFNSGTIDVTSSNVLTVAGVISDNWTPVSNAAFRKGTLVKSGTGTLEVTNANTYQGGTTLAAGTLLANNLTGSATGTGKVTIDGGTLGGAGTITGNVVAGVSVHTIAPSATLPSSTATTLTLGGLATNDATKMAFNLITPGVSSVNDRIKVTGANALGFTGGAINVSSAGGASSLGWYNIIEHNGFAGSLSSIALPAVVNNVAYQLDATTDPTMIRLHRGFLGDANDDGTVNFSDFIILSQNFGQNGTWNQANFTGASVVDFNDFVVLSQNFGNTIGANALTVSDEEIALFQSASQSFLAGAGIPEPTSLAMLGLGAAALLTRRRKTEPVA
jgi:autotransporter-associated beta strand protein